MLAFLFYLICWSLVVFLAFGLYGNLAWLMIGSSVVVTFGKWIAPWFNAWLEIQEEKNREENRQKVDLEQQRAQLRNGEPKIEKVVHLDDWR
jgi:hypothetical protein